MLPRPGPHGAAQVALPFAVGQQNACERQARCRQSFRRLVAIADGQIGSQQDDVRAEGVCAICKASCPSRACPATSISGSAASAARSCSRRLA